jgi:hypothetical protein
VSVADRVERFAGDVELASLRARTLSVVFGDRRGLALFLASACALFLFTRVGIFITDTFTTANAFAALTEGSLAVSEPLYGDSLESPGMSLVDGNYYGRNYGQLVFSLPAYALLRGLALVADLRIALVAGWSLGLLALSLVVGRVLDRRWICALLGSSFTLALFLLNVAVATPIPGRIVPVLALQLTSVAAGAFLAVVAYRLVAFLATPRVGVVAGLLVVFATPVGFWAPIPKRHVFTSLLALLAFFAFAKSRDDAQPHRKYYHAGAYATSGLLAWTHAPEAMALFVALVVADVVTSPLSRARALPVIVGGFLLSLLPFVVTNLLVTGGPLKPPRFIGTVEGLDAGSGSGSSGGGAGGGGDPGGGSGGSGTGTAGDGQWLPFKIPFFAKSIAIVQAFAWQVESGLNVAWYQTERFTQTFVRSGYVISHSRAVGEAVNLSVLESAPVLGGIVSPAVGGVAAKVTGTRERQLSTDSIATALRRPAPATGLALGLHVLLISAMSLPKLPLHAQITVRYLLPAYVAGVILLVLSPPVRRALDEHARTFGWALAGGALIGSQLLVVALVRMRPGLGEAFQFHAAIGLVLALAVAVGTLLAVLTDHGDKVLAAVLGIATASTAVFTFLIVTGYASSIGTYPNGGDQLLPVVRVLADILSLV